MLAMALVLELALAGCGNGTTDGNGGGGGGSGNTRDPVTYTGTADNGTAYTLKIEDGGSNAASTPATNDKYTLTSGGKTSTGTITVAGLILTLKPSNAQSTAFTVTVTTGTGIIQMTGTITWSDNTTAAAPAVLTPGGASSKNLSVAIYFNTSGVDSLEFTGRSNVIYHRYSYGLDVPGTYIVSGNTVTCTFQVPSNYGGGTSIFNYTLSDNDNRLTVHSSIGSIRPNVGVILTKQSSGSAAAFAGTWNASGGRSCTFTGNSFDYKVNNATQYSGTFSAYQTVILFKTSSGTVSCNYALSGSTITLSNSTISGVDGTYTKGSSGEGSSGVPSAAPTGVGGSVTSGTSVRLSWGVVTGATGYKIYCIREGYENTFIINGVTATTTSYTWTGEYGMIYLFWIVAFNSAGDGPASARYKVTMPQSGGGGATLTGTYYAIYQGSPDVNIKIIFNADYTFTQYDHDNADPGTYSVSGSTISLVSHGWSRNWTIVDTTTLRDMNNNLWTTNASTTPTPTQYYTVTYDYSNHESTLTHSSVVSAGGTIGYLASPVLYNDATFQGWDTVKAGTGTRYQPGDPYTPPGNITLYGIWDNS
jgi:hypothetical protein